MKVMAGNVKLKMKVSSKHYVPTDYMGLNLRHPQCGGKGLLYFSIIYKTEYNFIDSMA